jgi:hypothetical protein
MTRTVKRDLAVAIILSEIAVAMAGTVIATFDYRKLERLFDCKVRVLGRGRNFSSKGPITFLALRCFGRII